MMYMTVILITVGALGMVGRCYRKKTGGIVNQMKGRHHTDQNIVKIGENTEKSPGNLSRLTVIQTPVNAPYLILV